MDNKNHFDDIKTIFDLNPDDLDALVIFRQLSPEKRLELKDKIDKLTQDSQEKE